MIIIQKLKSFIPNQTFYIESDKHLQTLIIYLLNNIIIYFKVMKRSITLILFLLLISITNTDLLEAKAQSPPSNPIIKTLDVKQLKQQQKPVVNKEKNPVESRPKQQEIPEKTERKKTQQIAQQQDLTGYYCIKRPRPKNPAPPPNAKQMIVDTIYGFQMYINTIQISVSLYIRTNGTWDPSEINLIGHLVKPGANILNVGSQTGLQALIMGKVIGPTGKLFILEPYSGSFNLIQKSIQLNNMTSYTTLYNLGASDIKSRATLTISSINTGASSFVDRRKNPKIIVPGPLSYEDVELDLVDNILPNDVAIDFALIDVQMFEAKALKGMKNIIERSPNLVMIVQWSYLINPDKNQQQSLAIVDFLLQKGYQFYSYAGGDHKKCTLGKFTKKQNPRVDLLRIRSQNLLMIPPTVKLPV